jgi:hypothetical protein
MAIVVYDVSPIPPDPEHTRYLDAGPVRLGLEYRRLDDAELQRSYGDDAEAMAEIEAHRPAEIDDRGVSIHVVGAEDGHEYLRFDVFENGPHYHYIHRERAENKIVDYDPVAMGDMLPWALEQIRTRLATMLAHAGGEELARDIDAALLDSRLAELDELAREARRAQGIG